jgi:hypothetical protein
MYYSIMSQDDFFLQNWDDLECSPDLLRGIYAIGFEPRIFTYTNATGKCVPLVDSTPGVYGFGIGRPRTITTPTGGTLLDVGFEAFIKAIQAELPGILSA